MGLLRGVLEALNASIAFHGLCQFVTICVVAYLSQIGPNRSYLLEVVGIYNNRSASVLLSNLDTLCSTIIAAMQ